MKQAFFSFTASVAVLFCILGIFALSTIFIPQNSFITQPCVVERCDKEIVSTVPYSTTTYYVPIITATATPEFLKAFTASATYALDDESNIVLWDVSSTVSRPLASITKLMSALILTELPIPWYATTTIVKTDSDGSNTHLKVGETYSLKTLWQVALIGSSNTAINALVRMSGVSKDNFVERMNAKAIRLNLRELHFVEPTGLDSRNVGTSQDIARLLRFALKNEAIRSVLERPSVTIYPPNEKPRIVWSTNWLLTKWIPHSFAGLAVGKTGYTDDAGYNFTVKVGNSSGHALRIVVLGSQTPESRFIEAKLVGEWVFSHAVWIPVPSTSLQVSRPSSSLFF